MNIDDINISELDIDNLKIEDYTPSRPNMTNEEINQEIKEHIIGMAAADIICSKDISLFNKNEKELRKNMDEIFEQAAIYPYTFIKTLHIIYPPNIKSIPQEVINRIAKEPYLAYAYAVGTNTKFQQGEPAIETITQLHNKYLLICKT